MKILIMASIAALLSVGCAGPTVKRSSELTLPPPPTKEQAMQKINAYLNTTLLDPESARVSCADPSPPGWIWPGIGYEIQYGYLSICSVNAKNRFGGYTGAKQYVFRFNGPEFEHHDVIPKMGLIK